MRLCTIIFLAAAACSDSVHAQVDKNPVASISGKGQFEISGFETSCAEVPSWPLAVGDEMTTKQNSAVVMFPDSSRITLQKNSRARIERPDNVGSKIRFHLLKGRINYSLAKTTSVSIVVLSAPLNTAGNPIGTASVSQSGAVVRPMQQTPDAANDSQPKRRSHTVSTHK